MNFSRFLNPFYRNRTWRRSSFCACNREFSADRPKEEIKKKEHLLKDCRFASTTSLPPSPTNTLHLPFYYTDECKIAYETSKKMHFSSPYYA